jgi:hypothetical protein
MGVHGAPMWRQEGRRSTLHIMAVTGQVLLIAFISLDVVCTSFELRNYNPRRVNISTILVLLYAL